MSSHPIYDIPIEAWVLWQEDDSTANAEKGKLVPEIVNIVSEESLNRFVDGAAIDHIKLFKNGIQIWLQNGAFVSAYFDGDMTSADLYGANPPGKAELQGSWDTHADETDDYRDFRG